MDNTSFISKSNGLFVTGIPFGYFGVELSFGAGRTPNVITEEGPYLHWPWMRILLVSQQLVSSTEVLEYRSAYGFPVRVRYTVCFRACPDIRDEEDRNVFVVTAKNEPTLKSIKRHISGFIGNRFGWACRRAAAEDLLNSHLALEILGCCLLKLPKPPHEDSSFIGKRSLDDSELIQFYRTNRNKILGRYPETRLRPIRALIPGSAQSGRYCGQPLNANGRIANPRFHWEISDVERLQGIEVLDFQIEEVDFQLPKHLKGLFA